LFGAGVVQVDHAGVLGGDGRREQQRADAEDRRE
jgi:hypothetical protein